MTSVKVEDKSAGDADINNSEITFDNLVILREFGNIVNLVRNEDFLETVPKAKLRRVQWVPMFDCLKQSIFDEMVQELTSMWEYEKMPQKLEQLEKEKEKFGEINEDQTLWRPQLGDVKAQLRARDVANLQKQKILLESYAKEYEVRVNRLKKNLSPKRGYIKALQMDIQKHQKKNEDFIMNINDKFEDHEGVIKAVLPSRIDVKELCWTEKDLDIQLRPIDSNEQAWDAKVSDKCKREKAD